MVKAKIINVFNFLNRTDGSLKNKTLRSGFWVALSSGGLNIINLLKSIILARLLLPEVFGVMTICLIVIRGVEVFTETGFDAALIHRQSKFEEAKLTTFSLRVIRGFVLAMIVILISPLIADFYEENALNYFIKILAVSFILKGFINIDTVTRQKELDFKKISYLEQLVALSNAAVTISLAYYLRNIWALIIGQIFSVFAESVLSYIILPGKINFKFDKRIALELFKYGKFITGLSIVLFITMELDNVFVGKFIGMQELGYYVLAYTLANLQATHISKIVSRVMFPAYSKLQNDLIALKNAYIKVLKLVTSLTFPIAIVFIFLSPEIIKIVYGHKWFPSADVLPILAVFGASRSITSLNGYLFNAIGKPNISFYLVTGKFLLILILIYPLSLKFNIVGTALSVTVPMVFQLLLSTYLIARNIKVSIKTIAVPLLMNASKALIMVAAMLLLRQLVYKPTLLNLVCIVSFGGIVYVGLNYRVFYLYLKHKKSLADLKVSI